MKHVMTDRGCSTAALLWTCTALFGARVIGQLETALIAPAWLPDMDAWYSGFVPYHVLLPAQIALLMVMAAVAWNRRVRTGRFARANPRIAGALRMFALVYFAVMALRLAVNLFDHGAGFWRAGAIPVAFHWVLALFVAVAGRAPRGRDDEADEAGEIPYGDVPTLAQPLADALAAGKATRYGDAHSRGMTG